MKGDVFTEFLEMVEAHFSADMVDDIIDDAQPPNGGAYTAVGTYDHREMAALATALSRRSGWALDVLMRAFGEHLFTRFVAGYPQFFEGVSDAFGFLAGIEDVIHAEVRKLYPDAELPRFDVEYHDPKRLVLLYASQRHLEDLADGLIRGCLRHFGDLAEVSRESVVEGEQRRERFTLTRS